MKYGILILAIVAGCCSAQDGRAECVGGVCLAPGMQSMELPSLTQGPAATCDVTNYTSCNSSRQIVTHATIQTCSYNTKIRTWRPVRRLFGRLGGGCR